MRTIAIMKSAEGVGTPIFAVTLTVCVKKGETPEPLAGENEQNEPFLEFLHSKMLCVWIKISTFAF